MFWNVKNVANTITALNINQRRKEGIKTADNKGWIKLHRQIQDCWIWCNDEKFDKTHAWIDLLLLANHRGKKIIIEGNPKIIMRGQFHTSRLKLARRWNWNVKSVDRFLKLLEKDRMIVQEKSRVGTTINIVNYGVYQESMDNEVDNEVVNEVDNPMVNPMDNLVVNEVDTNKNEKNVKNDKNEKNERSIGEKFYPNDELLDVAFSDFVKMRKKIKKPMTDRAISSMMTRLDKLSGGDNDLAIQILDQSTRNCWQDVYALKTEKVVKGGNTNRGGYDWDNL